MKKSSTNGTYGAPSFGKNAEKPSKEPEFDEEKFLIEMIKKKRAENQAIEVKI
jgi:hypothetical protein